MVSWFEEGTSRKELKLVCVVFRHAEVGHLDPWWRRDEPGSAAVRSEREQFWEYDGGVCGEHEHALVDYGLVEEVVAYFEGAREQAEYSGRKARRKGGLEH